MLKRLTGGLIRGWEWGIPISHEDFLKVKKGDWNVLLNTYETGSQGMVS